MNIMCELRWYHPVAILIAASLMLGSAQGAEDLAELAFVQKIVSAINRDDKEARKNLMHPDALVCDQALKQAMSEGAYVPKQSKIPSGYRWEISPMPAGVAGWFPDKFDYPVRPTHQLNIDFDTAPTRSEGILLQVVRYRNEWREVTGCPKAETVAEAKHAAAARGKQEGHIRELAANIAPKLKGEVLRHLAEGRKVDAILHYRNASNEDLAVAKGVVEQLMQESEARHGK